MFNLHRWRMEPAVPVAHTTWYYSPLLPSRSRPSTTAIMGAHHMILTHTPHLHQPNQSYSFPGQGSKCERFSTCLVYSGSGGQPPTCERDPTPPPAPEHITMATEEVPPALHHTRSTHLTFTYQILWYYTRE